MNKYIKGTAQSLTAVILMWAMVSCATAPIPEPFDPWEPVPNEQIITVNMTFDDLQNTCSYITGISRYDFLFLGCVTKIGEVRRGEVCTIFMWTESKEYARTLKHERAHCRGWNHGDPQPEGTRP